MRLPDSQALLFAITIALALYATAAKAQAAGHSYTDYARVLQVEPIKEVAAVPVSKRRCDYPRRAQRADEAIAGDVRARRPGISIGAAIDEEIRQRESARALRRCRWVTTYENRERILAYRVRYDYGGIAFERRMRDPPGARVRVRVNLHAVR